MTIEEVAIIKIEIIAGLKIIKNFMPKTLKNIAIVVKQRHFHSLSA